MALLGKSEIEDFRTIVAGAGFPVDDFDLKEIEDAPVSSVFFVKGKVTICRKSTGGSRQYSAGHATAWLADFERDLRGHIFGTV